ncbi:MAG: cytochrome c3 family protein [Thermoanaerobaculia bacterium]|nr:cytochrome c3 family protein [Thermoanaerobaculia bacterium]
MAQVFHRSTNVISRLSIFGAVFVAAGLVGLFMLLDRSSYNTKQGLVIHQPVPFSHAHHVGGLGIDCRYCHSSVEKSANAGIPPTATCMNCHKQIWSDAPLLEPVRESYRSRRPIEWVKVHDLPDYAYFDHSVHLANGIGCASCHGRVDQMPLMYQHATLQMEWCLDCHRNPEAHVRPREHLYDMAWEADDRERLGPELVAHYGIRENVDCSTCHR